MTDETIFTTALKTADPYQRAAFLAAACAGDAALRSRIEALLAAHARAGEFLEDPAAGPAPPPGPTWRAPRPGAGDEPDAAEEPDEPLDFLEPPLRPDSLGRLGHYEALQVVGRGGFGIVFRAFDDVLQRVVAIKVLSPRMAATSPARKRFVREARGYAAVRHENVVQVHGIEAEPIPYLVMEFVPGESLETALAKSGPLDPADVVLVGTQLARGLAAAHAQNIIHRDIKPGNILLESGPDRRVKITDFGLARAADDASLTQSGMIAGTPMYMAPEQAHGHALDHRADLFSLGSVLYAMCTGRPPFRAATSMAVLKRVIEDTPRPVREVIPEVPDGLCAVIARLHQKNPDDRYQSAAEVADALATCLTVPAPAPVPAPKPVPSPEPTAAGDTDEYRAPGSPSRQLALIAATLLFLLGGLYAIYALTRSKAQAPGDTVQLPQQQPQPQPPRPEPGAPPPPLADLLTSPDWEWGAPVNLGPGVNDKGRDLAPVLTADELYVVFARGTPTDSKLWCSTRARVTEPFGPAEPLPDALSEGMREGASLSGDGLLLVFAARRGGSPAEELWASERKSRTEPFPAPERLPPPVNGTAQRVTAPVLSADGLTLLATVARGTPQGQVNDITMFTRKSRAEPFGGPVVLPGAVNTPNYEIACWVSDDRRVLVRTVMPDNKQPHETRLHVRATADGAFGDGIAFGRVPGAPGGFEPGRPWLSADGTRLYFHTRVLGGAGDLDLWVMPRVPKKK